MERGILIEIGIVRQQFMGQQPPIGPPGDDVGKGTAPVDPELPARDRPIRQSTLVGQYSFTPLAR